MKKGKFFSLLLRLLMIPTFTFCPFDEPVEEQPKTTAQPENPSFWQRVTTHTTKLFSKKPTEQYVDPKNQKSGTTRPLTAKDFAKVKQEITAKHMGTQSWTKIDTKPDIDDVDEIPELWQLNLDKKLPLMFDQQEDELNIAQE